MNGFIEFKPFMNCFNEFNLNRGDSCWLTRFLRVNKRQRRGDAM